MTGNPDMKGKKLQIASEDAAQLPGKKGSRGKLPAVFGGFFSRAGIEAEEETLDWLVDADIAQLQQDPARARAILYLVAGSLLLLLVWAGFAKVDEITRGEAKVIPTRQIQVVQSLDGGVVTHIEVQEGDEVEAGELLVRLDATRSTSSLRENEIEYLALQAKASRLRAVAEGVPFEPEQAWLDKIPDVVSQQRILYGTSIAQLASLKNIAEQQLEQRQQELAEVEALRKQSAQAHLLAMKELTKTKPLLASGAVS
ncbi:MAG: biotin/lipoyl-binding protein, partial [Pseudomonadales bacterium]